MSDASDHAARVQRARALMEDQVVSIEDAAALAGPPPGSNIGPDVDAWEAEQESARQRDDDRIIARHIAVRRYALGRLPRGMARTIRARMPRVRRRGAGRPGGRRRPSRSCSSGSDPGDGGGEPPAPPVEGRGR